MCAQKGYPGPIVITRCFGCSLRRNLYFKRQRQGSSPPNAAGTAAIPESTDASHAGVAAGARRAAADAHAGETSDAAASQPPRRYAPEPFRLHLPHAVEGDVWRLVLPPIWGRDEADSWVDVRIPRGHFPGTTVLAAPTEWRLPFAPMRPSSYRGDTLTECLDEQCGGGCGSEEVPVHICDASGRLPAATGRDRTGQALPPLPPGDLSADFPQWRESFQKHLSRYVTGEVRAILVLALGRYQKGQEDSVVPPARGGFLDAYPRYRAALWCCLDKACPEVPERDLSRAMDSWGPRFDGSHIPRPYGVAA